MKKWEQKTLINELVQGLELAKQLKDHLTAASSPFATVKTAGLRSKFKDQKMTRLFLTSHTEEGTSAPARTNPFQRLHRLRVDTDLDNKESESPFPFPSTTSFGGTKSENHAFLPPIVDNNRLLGCYSSSFLSPSTPETSYFSLPPSQMNYASELAEIMSANTSATNSPILNLDFSLDQVEIDRYFPLDSPGFFS